MAGNTILATLNLLLRLIFHALVQLVAFALNNTFQFMSILFWAGLGTGILFCIKSRSYRPLIVLWSLVLTVLSINLVMFAVHKFGLSEKLDVDTAMFISLCFLIVQHGFIGGCIFKFKGVRLPTILFSLPALVSTWVGAFVIAMAITNSWL